MSPQKSPHTSRLGGRETGFLMAVAGMSTVQLGSALTVPLFDQLTDVGPPGFAWAGPGCSCSSSYGPAAVTSPAVICWPAPSWAL